MKDVWCSIETILIFNVFQTCAISNRSVVLRALSHESPQIDPRSHSTQMYVHSDAVPGLGTISWSPLACGFLTGKYGDDIPAHSRATLKVSRRSDGRRRSDARLGPVFLVRWRRSGQCVPHRFVSRRFVSSRGLFVSPLTSNVARRDVIV